MKSRVTKILTLVILCAAVAAMPALTQAQLIWNAPGADNVSQLDVFAGYSYIKPLTDVSGVSISDVKPGGIASVALYFNKYFGVELVGDGHRKAESSINPLDLDFAGGSAGVIGRYPIKNWTPFAHVLMGGEKISGYYVPSQWGPVLTAGGGLDYNPGWYHHRLAIRLLQADYQYIHEDWGSVAAEEGIVRASGFYSAQPQAMGGVSSGAYNFNLFRLSAGVVFRTGTFAPPAPVTISCATSPSVVYPGDPVTVTSTAGNLNAKDKVVYTWSGDGVSGKDTTATVDTSKLAPGTYTVKCGVKEGVKPWQIADSLTTFTIKAYEPPTITCSPNPATIKPGESSTITAAGVSPQNRPLTYSYETAAGKVSGNGTTAVYDSTGVQPGTVKVTCSTADDKGHTASADTFVNVVAPPAPAPHVSALCSITFDKDMKRPTRVDNEAKACLDEVALDLQKQTDAKAVVVGDSDAKEQAGLAKDQKAALKNKKMMVVDPAAQRAVNTKDYLVTEKGIDPARISTATGTADGQKVENYLVPAGADFASEVKGTTPVNESVVKPVARKPLAAKADVKKHAAKMAAAKK